MESTLAILILQKKKKKKKKIENSIFHGMHQKMYFQFQTRFSLVNYLIINKP